MKYERLTERDEDGIAVYKQKCDADNFEENLYIHAQREGAVVNRLAELEDKIENGTLRFIPCKVGDKFYGIQGNHYFKYEVRAIVITRHEIWLETVYEMRFLYGEEAFLTEEETEKKLKELKE